jgi:hypothetical protein
LLLQSNIRVLSIVAGRRLKAPGRHRLALFCFALAAADDQQGKKEPCHNPHNCL